MANITAAERAQLEQWLREAKQARHTMALGGGIRTFVDQNGERIEYGPSNMTALNKYIYSLELQLGNVEGPAETWMV